MKIFLAIFILFLAYDTAKAHCLEPYGKQVEVAQFYEFEDDTLCLYPYMYDKVWYKGKRVGKEFVINVGDHFWVMRDSKYHKFTFHGAKGAHLSFTQEILSYSLTPEKNKRQRIIPGQIIEKHDFLTEQSFWLLVSYRIFLESAPEKNRWKTR